MHYHRARYPSPRVVHELKRYCEDWDQTRSRRGYGSEPQLIHRANEYCQDQGQTYAGVGTRLPRETRSPGIMSEVGPASKTPAGRGRVDQRHGGITGKSGEWRVIAARLSCAIRTDFALTSTKRLRSCVQFRTSTGTLGLINQKRSKTVGMTSTADTNQESLISEVDIVRLPLGQTREKLQISKTQKPRTAHGNC